MATDGHLADALSEDPAVPGQAYACVSFLSPEKVIARRDVFHLKKYLTAVSESTRTLLAHLRTRFPDASSELDAVEQAHGPLLHTDQVDADLATFVAVNSDALTEEFDAANSFQTSVRGLKVRGSYSTIEAAKHRADVMKAHDPLFDVYVAEVGKWCPWQPDPESVTDVEYPDQQLNRLMHKYKEGIAERDDIFSADVKTRGS
jgi:hypothetical protein